MTATGLLRLKWSAQLWRKNGDLDVPRMWNHSLGNQGIEPQDSKSKLVVQCRVCGAVVRVLNYTSANLNELTQRLGYYLAQ